MSFSWFHLLQLVVLATVIGLVVERVRLLAYVSAIDPGPLRRALARLARRRDLETLRAVVSDARPAWAADCAWPLVDPELPEGERAVEVEERLMDAEALATRNMRTLRIAATIASAFGFIGAAAQIWWIFNGEHGLASLEAGRVESEGLSRAVLSIALGIAASSLSLGSWTVLKGVARERIRECRRVVGSLEEALGLHDRDGGQGDLQSSAQTDDEPGVGP